MAAEMLSKGNSSLYASTEHHLGSKSLLGTLKKQPSLPLGTAEPLSNAPACCLHAFEGILDPDDEGQEAHADSFGNTACM
jgi:hypothetical protein